VERRIITKGTSEWEGWGTALKPAWEPIIVARKPLIGTVAENVLKYETGGMNIDGCRIATDETRIGNVERSDCSQIAYGKGWQKSGSTPPAGRWPANLIHDGSDEVVGLFPVTKSGSIKPHKNAGSTFQSSKEILATTVGDSGSAARFFYCAKASKQDRGEGCEGMEAKEKHTRNSYGDQSEYDCPDGANRQGNKGTSIARNYHPTVKPTALMRYLCKLVTPPKGIVLDPFMGSGSTGKAALQEGFDFIGIDIDEEYANIAKARIHHITDLFTQPEAI
jgi:site-specific DNA-methyltransferase (adenine-specific)